MLPPYDYTFVVRAIDGQNIESPLETTFTFEVLPYFYETRWFQILVVLTFILIMYVVISKIKNNHLQKETLNKEIT